MATLSLNSMGLRRSCFGNVSALRSKAPSTVSVSCSPRPRLKVCMMSKRTVEIKEIREMSDEQILETVVDLKGELFLMRCKKVTRQDYRVTDYKNMKKKIARMLTVHRERELERGIKPRESRKLKRAWRRGIVYRPPPSLAAILDAQEKEKEKEKP